MKNRFQKQSKFKNKLTFLIPIVICLIMAAALWNSSSRIFSETRKKQEESTRSAVIKGAVQCYAVEGRYPESLSYLEQHYGVSYDKDKFIVSYEIVGSNRMPQVTVIAVNERRFLWRDKNIWWIRCFSLSCLRHLRYAHLH